MNYLQKTSIIGLSLIFSFLFGMNLMQAQKSGVAAFIPSTGQWLLDYDADGRIDKKVTYGAKGYTDELPLVGDFNGDGVAELGRFRTSTGNIFIDQNADGRSDLTLSNMGKRGDQVAVADFNNRGKSSVAIHRPSAGGWAFDYNMDGRFDGRRDYGQPNKYQETIHAGDFNGDGKVDLCIYRSSTGQWFVDTNGDNKSDLFVQKFGGSGIQGTVGDFNGDGKADIATHNPGSARWEIDYNMDGRADRTFQGTGGSQTIGIAIPSNLERKYGRDISKGRPTSSSTASTSKATAVKVSLVNHSDWTVRFKFMYKDGSQSGWTTIKAHTSKSANSIAKPVKGVAIKWLDISTWKNIGGMGLWEQNGTTWNYTVSGKVFPHKPIKIN